MSPEVRELRPRKDEIFVVQGKPITTLSNRPFIRNFQKFFAREIPLVVMEYWHRGEYKELHKILHYATHFNPLFIRDRNGLTDVYYDMNNPDTDLQPLFDYFENDVQKFNLLIRAFEIKRKNILDLLNDFESGSFPKLFDAIAEAWGVLPIWVQLGSTDKEKVSPEMKEKSYKLRDQFQKIEYKAGEMLLSVIKEKCPELKEHADVISAREIIENDIPNLEELELRKDGFIFFEDEILPKISREEFAKKYRVILMDDLATIGEDNSNMKNVVVSEDLNFIKGKTAYPGFTKGRVRIITSNRDLDTIQNGEVLVTNMTTPEFVPALQKVAAFITNEGGILSHAAIVARELKRPCVIGTKNATKKLRTGDEVEVDATNGMVKILR